jgi:hypothetical protein
MKQAVFFILLGCCGVASGQLQTSLNGLVLNGETFFVMENVNVRNLSRRTLATTNRDGAFVIYAGENDTLLFTAIGFTDREVAVRDVLSDPAAFVVVMPPTVYALGEVTINPLGTYQQFKWKVLALKLPPAIDYAAMLRLPKPTMPLIPSEYDYRKVFRPSAYINHPITTLYKRFSKEEQAKIGYYRFLHEEWPVIKAVNEKYNGGRVAAITGLEGDSLMLFMQFCNFERNYLYVTSEYDIGIAITEKLKEFRGKTAVAPTQKKEALP